MIQRYLWKEVAWPVLAWLSLLVVLMWLMAVLKGTEVLLGSRVTLSDFAQVSVCLLPHFVAQAAPVAYLLGLLIGLGRLSADRELLALLSFGVAPKRVWVAPLLLAAVTSALLAVLAFGPQPMGLQAAHGQVGEIIKRNLVGDVKSGVFHTELQQVTLYVERVEGPGRWANVMVYDERVPDAPVLLLAERGEVDDSVPGEPIRLRLSRGALYRVEAENDVRLEFETSTLALGVEEAIWQKNRFRALRDELTPLQMLEAARGLDPTAARPMAVAAHWKLGQVLMPLSFAFLGVPLGLRRRTAGKARGVVWTLLGYAAFYVLAQVSTSLGDRGQLAPVLAGQLPNLIFVTLGLFALAWAQRRSVST